MTERGDDDLVVADEGLRVGANGQGHRRDLAAALRRP